MKKILLVISILCSSVSYAKISPERAVELFDKIVKLYDQDKDSQETLKINIRKVNPILMDEEEYVFGEEGIWGRADNDGTIFIAGGVLSNDFFTDDTLLALLCHEVGHLLGGQPASKYNMSYEGQADYYAASVCMKKFFMAYPKELARKDYLHEYYFRVCGENYTTPDNIRICVKTMQAGLNLSIASNLSIGEILLPGPAVNEYEIADETLEYRYSAQCIADTFEAGALCKDNYNRVINFQPETVSACDNRPKCWFKKEE